jgi:hypothetical protein
MNDSELSRKIDYLEDSYTHLDNDEVRYELAECIQALIERIKDLQSRVSELEAVINTER